MSTKKLLGKLNTPKKTEDEAEPQIGSPTMELKTKSITYIENDFGAWACYANGELVLWGGSVMNIKELKRVLGSDVLYPLVLLDGKKWSPEAFPKYLAEVPEEVTRG